MKFQESLIKYEALTKTPLRELFNGLSLDRQIELLDLLVVEVEIYAQNNALPYPDQKTWIKFQKTADWENIAKRALRS